MDKLKDVAVLFFAGGDGGSNSFAPTHACLAASSLSNAAVDHRMANFTFGAFRFLCCFLRLNDITRWRLGRVVGILLQTSDLFFQDLDRFLERLDFRHELFDHKVFSIHASCIPRYPPSRKSLISTFWLFYQKICERLQ